MKPIVYSLEVIEPCGTTNHWLSFTASPLFLTMFAGHLFNPRAWPGSHLPIGLLRAVHVAHFIWETESKVHHKLLVFAEPAEVSKDVGFGNWPLRVKECGVQSDRYRISESIYPGEAPSLAEAREAIEEGFGVGYAWVGEHRFDGADVASAQAQN